MRTNFYSAWLIVFGLVMAGCESTTNDLGSSDVSTTNVANPYLKPSAAKLFSEDSLYYGSASLEDNDGNTWVLDYDGIDTTTVPGATRFYYTLNKPAGSQGTHFAYRIPECSNYIDGSATPTPTENANANGDFEWGPSDISTGTTSIYLDFNNPPGATSVPLGVAVIGLKSPGDGNAQSEGEIVGPCRGRYSFSGIVFLNDDSPDLGITPNDTWDQDVEPGLAHVEVTLEECYENCGSDINWSYDSESGVEMTSGDPDSFGRYKFEVVGPPIVDAPIAYRVRINKAATEGGINLALFNSNIFDVACDGSDCPTVTSTKVYREYALNPDGTTDYQGVDFGFEVDEDSAIAAFEVGDLVSDGMDRDYWKAQANNRASGGYSVDFPPAEFQSMLDCSGGFESDGSVNCILGGVDDNDFAGDVDNLIETIFNGGVSLAEAQAILKNDSNNDAQEGLRTQILTALLNYVDGRGLCGPLDTSVDDGNGRCNSYDDAATRTVIESAIVVLVNSGYVGVSKLSSGSVGSSTDLLRSVN